MIKEIDKNHKHTTSFKTLKIGHSSFIFTQTNFQIVIFANCFQTKRLKNYTVSKLYIVRKKLGALYFNFNIKLYFLGSAIMGISVASFQTLEIKTAHTHTTQLQKLENA